MAYGGQSLVANSGASRVRCASRYALSIKDIIRTLRNDPERTEQLKAIVIRTDIDDAKKLEMASALVA